ncbi:MAG: nicotinate (nicotinamide) nucleotide adenylyltransferase [Candidatus Dadabacteria bacterium]
MKVGLYFGSFNPIHIGHLVIASHLLNETDLQKIWFVVSPLNPFKESESLVNEYDRLHLVQKAIEDDPRFKVTDIEFTLPRPSYTINTLTYLVEKYPGYEFRIIMGSDSYQNIMKWKNPEQILSGYGILVYRRPGFDVTPIEGSRTTILDAPLLQISATHIRELVRKGKSIKYLVPAEVENEIRNSNLFRKTQKK